MSDSPLPADPGAPPDADDGAERAPSDVVVIGGAGFIGSHLVDRLLADGVSVEVVDDLSSGTLGNLAAARRATRQGGGDLRIHTVDAATADMATLIGMRRPRQVVHLGLLVPGASAVDTLGRAFTSALTVLDAARLAGVEKVVVLLPATVLYGAPSARQLPVREGELTPRGLRGVVAKAVVDLLVLYREEHGIEFTALAATTVYGPRQRPDRVVARLLGAAAEGEPARLTGDGRQTRDFVYVDDVVDALVRARQRGSGLVVNVGTGVQTSLRDLVAMIGGGPEPTFIARRESELARFCVSPVRARIHLGWAPWTTLADGLATMRG